MSRARQGDDGFTLIESVIAILVISIAVVTMVGFLTTMIALSQNHRGHAVAETAARSFGQAVQATAQASAALVAPGVTSTTQTTFVVADATVLPGSGHFLLDREIVLINSVNRTNGALTVTRAQGGTTPSTHLVTATSTPKVLPLLTCPTPAQLTPHPSSYRSSPGVVLTVTKVEYVDPDTGLFTTTTPPNDACTDDYEELCPSGTLLPECGSGFFRVSISVTTGGDSRLNNVAAATQVLVRSGSA